MVKPEADNPKWTTGIDFRRTTPQVVALDAICQQRGKRSGTVVDSEKRREGNSVRRIGMATADSNPTRPGVLPAAERPSQGRKVECPLFRFSFWHIKAIVQLGCNNDARIPLLVYSGWGAALTQEMSISPSRFNSEVKRCVFLLRCCLR